MFGHADACRLIGFNALRLDIPAGIAGRTGVEFGVDELVEAFAFEFGFFADTLKAAAALFGIEAHGSAGTGLVFEVVNQLIAGYGRTVLIQGKAVAGGNGIGGLVVLRPIGIENIGIALDNDVAFGTDADLGLAFYFIGVDAGVIGRQGWLAAAFDFGGFGRLGIFMVAKQASAAQGKRIGFALAGFCRFGFGGVGRGIVFRLRNRSIFRAHGCCAKAHN